MNYYQIRVLALIGLFAFFFQSCAEDKEITTAEAFNNQNRGGGNNGQGQGGNGGSNDDVFRLDNDVAVEWMDLFLELDRYITGMRPNSTARALAYINLAAYETAVPGMRGFSSNSRFLDDFKISSNVNTRDMDWELALNTCYADVMEHFLLNVPANLKPRIAQLEADIAADLTAGLSNRVINESIQRGTYVAERVIQYSQTDQEAEAQILEPQPLSYQPPAGDGFWTYSADEERGLFPYWESVRTFVIAPNQTTTVPPVAYSEDPNSNYYQQMEEVYASNNTAKAQNNDDLWVAEFWSDDVEGLMFSPPARQISIANQLIEGESMNLEEALHLYLKLGFSLNDAAVSTWKYKYEYMVMRPNVYIHEFIDADFQTNLYRLIYWPNPSFPGYPSGHSCFASAAAGVFIEFFGNQINFTDRSHQGRTEFLGAPRTFATMKDMAEENAYSRIPLGVHIRMDCTEGLRLGYEISDAVNQYNVKRKPQL